MSTVTAVPLRPVKRSYLIYLWIGLALALVSAFALARQGDDVMTRNARARGVVTTASGLQYKVLKPGAGAKPTDTDVALINYEGKLLDGSTFDKSQQPTPMPVSGVVPGFSEALKLMPKGAKYRVWLPAALGYGDKSPSPAIPANSTLVFDIELLDFLPQEVIQRMQQQQMMMGGGAPGGPAGPGGMPPGVQPQR
ncbi:FKBP-type peptidyl-prolyl cis-trans isomerase [Microvirga sp. SRT01]|uniref:Peptidyl-prolyl cis-trans isomerase n=1 Tax=Sphingomonas longa TaxID=2778730 RepID=A0ABS2D3A6_9SPHN|nr:MULTISPECIES: FKBP-type peptidyl-prolyl cis-trans isomerase [Alphaproteobacteria]MBM6575405.1 FKBP-type peptidyl-prolyl cis-trans isomerase [Sphingomonas sp. BT552]MBR7708454.1 FKBP-type peptidyl-prolyl cis-trans isomerase [Microvirga sp. SRT01]